MNTMENKNIKTGLVIMASGLGKRFGSNKLLEMLGEKPLVRWIIDTTDGLFDRRIVVTRSADVKKLCDNLHIECILHELPNRNDTVRLGLSAVMTEVDYCFFTPGDQPLISRETVERLIKEANDNRYKIIRACYDDISGSPMGFPKQFFDELLKLPEGKGGNWVAKNNQELIQSVKTQNEYELWDVDTVSDLEMIKNILKIK